VKIEELEEFKESIIKTIKHVAETKGHDGLHAIIIRLCKENNISEYVAAYLVSIGVAWAYTEEKCLQEFEDMSKTEITFM
jgi:hypothetical protein